MSAMPTNDAPAREGVPDKIKEIVRLALQEAYGRGLGDGHPLGSSDGYEDVETDLWFDMEPGIAAYRAAARISALREGAGLMCPRCQDIANEIRAANCGGKWLHRGDGRTPWRDCKAGPIHDLIEELEAGAT